MMFSTYLASLGPLGNGIPGPHGKLAFIAMRAFLLRDRAAA
jgi:hypothetical protein